MKRDQKRSQEKISAQMDARVRSIEDVRKGVEAQILTLQKTNAELTSKYVSTPYALQLFYVDFYIGYVNNYLAARRKGSAPATSNRERNFTTKL